MNDLFYAEDVLSLKITNQGSYDDAADAIAQTVRDITRIEAECDSELRPVLREADEIKARYAGDLELLNEAKNHLRARITAYYDTSVVNGEPPRRAANTTISQRWKAQVTDLGALIRYVYQNEEEASDLIKPDQAKLTALARKDKDNFDIPGVKAIKSTSLGVGRH